MLRSLMALYLHSPDIQAATQTQRPTKVRDSEVGKKLTERQELILSMIKNGMTNNAIANRMGYSESLIRQETMSIYQKLGVDGRREIIKNDSLDENSNNENYGI
jgi:DNA-binding NarL/FixJ family response regulator